MAQYTIEFTHELDNDDHPPQQIIVYASILHQPSCGYFHHIDQIWTEPPLVLSQSLEDYLKDEAREQL